MASSKHFLNASKLLPESSRTHISIVGIGYVLIAFNIISATTCGGFLITTPTSKRFEDQVVYLHLGCRRQNHQQLTLHQSPVFQVVVLVVDHWWFVHCGCCNGVHLPGSTECISCSFGVSEDAHVHMNAAAFLTQQSRLFMRGQ